MSKKAAILVVIALVILALVTIVGVCKFNQNFQKTATAILESPNEPELNFKPSYHEDWLPLSKFNNFQAIKDRYGLKLTAEQEKNLENNRFLLLDYSQFVCTDTIKYLRSRNNFDQWLTDFDTLGGVNTINFRVPADAVLMTPDTMLHAYHKYLEITLERLEETDLSNFLGKFLVNLHHNLAGAVAGSNGEVKKHYQNLEAQIVLARVLFENKNSTKPDYFSSPEEEIAYGEKDKTIDSETNAEILLTKYSQDLPLENVDKIKSDLIEIYKANAVGSSPLFNIYDDQIKTDYTQFTPRSHYNKSSALRAYFRTMMYLGRSSYLLKSDQAIGDINLLAKQMVVKNNGVSPLDDWKKITTITNFYAGQSDDISYEEWNTFLKNTIGDKVNSDNDLISADSVSKITANLGNLRKPKILSDIIVDENIASRDKADLLRQSLSFRIFGQKFTFDARILNDLTAGQEKTKPKLPSTPSALFVAGALGDQQAKKYSGEFLKQSADFSNSEVDEFMVKFDQKKTDVKKIKTEEWFGSLSSAWLYVLGALTHNYGSNYPLYMQSLSFLDKQIQSFLGSYAELKHDTLLYAKQSYAELGAGDGDLPPVPPVVKGFVEPNLEFWNRFNSLINKTQELYTTYNLFKNDPVGDRLTEFKKISELCAKIAEQELRGQTISDDDYESLRNVRLYFMAQPLNSVDPDETSNRTGLIADIHTDAVKGQILYEATGKPYLMLALVANENSPRVVVGLVYNHYELTDGLTKRLNDEGWRKRVYEDGDLPAKNFWYQSLLVK